MRIVVNNKRAGTANKTKFKYEAKAKAKRDDGDNGETKEKTFFIKIFNDFLSICAR